VLGLFEDLHAVLAGAKVEIAQDDVVAPLGQLLDCFGSV